MKKKSTNKKICFDDPNDRSFHNKFSLLADLDSESEVNYNFKRDNTGENKNDASNDLNILNT